MFNPVEKTKLYNHLSLNPVIVIPDKSLYETNSLPLFSILDESVIKSIKPMTHLKRFKLKNFNPAENCKTNMKFFKALNNLRMKKVLAYKSG